MNTFVVAGRDLEWSSTKELVSKQAPQGSAMAQVERCWAERWGHCFLVKVEVSSGEKLRHFTAFSREPEAKALVERVIARGQIELQYWRGEN